MLVIKNISKAFKGRQVLRNVSLEVPSGTIAFLLGSSGVGKSTLLRLLNNLEPLDTGQVLLNGKILDLTKINQEHSIGMVFQHFNLFDHLTATENITLALEKVLKKSSEESQKIAQNLLAHYGLADKGNAYPAQLSGGQKQRLAIARTVALQPAVLCLDEPTSALDPVLTNHVASTITDLATQGLSILVASHDVSLLQRLTCTVYLMQEGAIVETAPSAELAVYPERYPQIKNFIAGHS